jgi:beta-lactamase class A
MIDLPPAQRIQPLQPPVIVQPGPRQASFGDLVARLDPSTTHVIVTVNGNEAAEREASGGRIVIKLSLPQRDSTIRVIARDGSGGRAADQVGPVYGFPRAGRPRWFQGEEDSILARRIRRLAFGFNGISAVYVQNLRTGKGAAWNARARFPAASTLKLGIALEVLRVLRAQPGPNTRVGDLLRRMIVYSDNAAANSLLVWLGGSQSGGAARVNASLRTLGIMESQMYGGYIIGTSATRPIPLRIESQPAFGIGKYTTAWDLAKFHRLLHLASVGRGSMMTLSGYFTSGDARHLLFLLTHVSDPGKLDRFIGDLGVSVPHKAGWITHARHDSGIVYWAGGAFVVTVMTWNGAIQVGTSADVLAGRIAEAALERFGEAGSTVSPLAFRFRSVST